MPPADNDADSDRSAPPAAEPSLPSVPVVSDDHGPDRLQPQSPPDAPIATDVSPGLSALLGFGIAAAACVAFGWLGYQLVTRLGPQPQQETPAAGSAPIPHLPSPPPGGPSAGGSSRTPSGAAPSWPGADPAVLQVSLQCLARGQSESSSPADPSNYGARQAVDWQNRPVPHAPEMIVLHETVVAESSALELFRRRHGDDGQQASYHVLIGRDGRRIRVVDDAQRAFGAGDSSLQGRAVQLKPGLEPSVNNIALHVSLVSPDDGADGEARSHRGYTPEQYRSLATQIALWQARYGISASRVVTHQEVDRSGTRRDPRSFDWALLGRELGSQWVACGGSSRLADLGRSAVPATPGLR
ncbi:MAG: N-acetylmuramoyl-L-alanine amidase [Cyanobium sp.]